MKPLFAAVILALFVTVVVPTVGGQNATKAASAVTEAEYEVLSAYITSEFTGDSGKDRVGHRVFRIVIADKSQSDMVTMNSGMRTANKLPGKRSAGYCTSRPQDYRHQRLILFDATALFK